MEGKPIEQFVLLARSAQGVALCALIEQALDAPGVYVFGEMLEVPSVQELSNGPHAPHFQLLQLFAYGTYSDYTANSSNLPNLSEAQKNKLRHLTIVSLAAKMKCIPYGVLLSELGLSNLRHLEDVIIEAIYADIVHGKLDQRRRQLEVDTCIGRDVRASDANAIINTLQQWCDGCEAVLLNIEAQILRANSTKENQIAVRAQIENEVSSLKQTMKAAAASAAQEMDQVVESRDAMATPDPTRHPGKKPSKVKGLRGSGKIWSKSN